jgi:GT2 family glycosyltransferase
MISVILYGRNDAHGYNLHRRAALSLNCIAEVLTEPDDEVIFVDYNTPDELPTFIEAISDTLTARCLALLRVLRVRAEIHEERFASRTHLPALEPIARNVAARRANPSNRWLLSTNTDMIFVPRQRRSMSEICSSLPDGFYGLPRFEIPEWLWERLPRSDPDRSLTEIERLGPALKLDEPTVSHEWIRFDAPGDFQLILRKDFVAIDGFDEEMLLGYHVDSNISRRLLLHRGSIESLEQWVAGYHCNHNRTRTVYHGAQRVANDLERFFFSVDLADLKAQRATWGLAGVEVEEIPVRERASLGSADALAAAVPPGPRTLSDAWGAPFSLTYDSGHVLPFVADTLLISPPDATVGYVGANTVFERMLGDVVNELGFQHPLLAVRLDDMTGIDQVAKVAEVFVIDLGLDVSQSDGRFPRVLAHTLLALERLVELERGRLEHGEHPRAMILVNSSSAFWDAYVLAQFDCSYTTIHSRVRRATVKRVPESNLGAIEMDVASAHRVMSWYARDKMGGNGVVIGPGESIEFAAIEDYSGFGTGWAVPEDTGIWTEGERSELNVVLGEAYPGEYVMTLGVGMICIESDQSLTVDLLANGNRVATRAFTDSVGRPWRVVLPPGAVGGSELGLTLRVDHPRSPAERGWSTDKRRLGIHLRTLRLEAVDRSVRVGDKVEFGEGSGAQRLLGDGWSELESTGVWTVEDIARVVFRPTDGADADVELVLEVVPFLAAHHRKLEVEVSGRGQRLAEQIFRQGDGEGTLHVHVPRTVMNDDGQVVLELRMRRPARPVDLGLGSDPRRLGLYLRSLTVIEPGSYVIDIVDPSPRTLGKLRKQLTRSLRS